MQTEPQKNEHNFLENMSWILTFHLFSDLASTVPTKRSKSMYRFSIICNCVFKFQFFRYLQKNRAGKYVGRPKNPAELSL